MILNQACGSLGQITASGEVGRAKAIVGGSAAVGRSLRVTNASGPAIAQENGLEILEWDPSLDTAPPGSALTDWLRRNQTALLIGTAAVLVLALAGGRRR